ncbi:MAG: response regulator [Magnetococcales bacterium]|nr:response regulator [Magnetococcales bacterium]
MILTGRLHWMVVVLTGIGLPLTGVADTPPPGLPPPPDEWLWFLGALPLFGFIGWRLGKGNPTPDSTDRPPLCDGGSLRALLEQSRALAALMNSRGQVLWTNQTLTSLMAVSSAPPLVGRTPSLVREEGRMEYPYAGPWQELHAGHPWCGSVHEPCGEKGFLDLQPVLILPLGSCGDREEAFLLLALPAGEIPPEPAGSTGTPLLANWLFDCCADPVLLEDPKGRPIYQNRAMTRFLNLSRPDHPPCLFNPASPYGSRTIQLAEPEHREFRVHRQPWPPMPWTTLVLMRATTAPPDPDNPMERAGLILCSSPDPIVTVDHPGRIVDWNPAAERLFGITRRDALGKAAVDLLFPPEDGAIFQQLLRNLSGSIHPASVPSRMEVALNDPRGRVFPGELAIVATGNGPQRRLSLFLRDLSEQKSMEGRILELNQELEKRVRERTLHLQEAVSRLEGENRERHRAEIRERESRLGQHVISRLLATALEPLSLQEQLDQALDRILSIPWLSHERKGCIFLANPENGWLVMHSQSGLSQAIRTSCQQLAPGSCLCGQAASRKVLVAAGPADPGHTIVYPGMLPHGHYCVPILSGTTLLGVLNLYLSADYVADPSHPPFLETLSNTLAGVIELRQMEKWRRRHQEVEAANAAKSTFLNHMSHEIRTPVEIIQNVSDLLLKTPLSSQQREFVEQAQKTGESLLATINDILDLSRMEAGKLILDIQSFPLKELLDSATALFSLQAREKNITLHCEWDPGLPQYMEGDPNRLRQILFYLVNHALHMTPPGGVVQLRLQSSPQERLQVSVSDQAPALPLHVREGLFQPFQTFGPTFSTPPPGTGLWLPIVDRLVRLMNGLTWMEALPEKGHCIHCSLPLHHPDCPGQGPSPPPEPPLVPEELAGYSLLLVDDSEEHRILLAAFMKKSAYHLDWARDGLEGVEKFKAGNYDLVLMDIHMPHLDGLAATRAIRQWETDFGRPPVPIIVLTADQSDETVVQAASNGGSYFLTKPITKKKVFRLLAEALENKKPKPQKR